MTFVGVRIEGGFLEVGFRAATRREYEEQQRVVAAAADLFWPVRVETPDLARDPAESPQSEDFVAPGDKDFTWNKPLEDLAPTRPDLRRKWLERHGLT